MSKNERKLPRSLGKLKDVITSPADLLGERKPSVLFRPMVGMLSHLLTGEPERMVSRWSMGVRRLIHPIIKLLGPMLLTHRQVFEDPNDLLGLPAPQQRRKLPDAPVIWCANHRFKDDILATVLSARHGYILFGSLPAFFNTFDGVSAYLNGIILCNRKIRARKKSAQDTVIRTLGLGKDVLIFPEGVWNKYPDKLLLELWPGIYRAATETGAKIIPVIHYLADPQKKYKTNLIHTVVADPISVEGLSEAEGLSYIRDTMATWYFLLMERYGQTTREALLGEYATANDAWEGFMQIHTSRVAYYDREIETCADYRPRRVVRPEGVWQAVADIQRVHSGNIGHVHYARQLLQQETRRDFQRRF